MSSSPAELTIGSVAGATDLSVATLRAWEQRHGFPVAKRLPSGHRRYTARDVEQIREVLRDRDAGLSLDAAIARAMARDGRPEQSIFAALRRRHPGLPVHVMSRRAMIAISRAIEDECCSRAAHPVLIGSFQREHFYRQSEHRWRELARTAERVVVFADFRRSRRRRGAPTEIAVGSDDPMVREWAVVCDAPDAAACVAAIERPGSGGRTGKRCFEAMWSVDPGIVRTAADIGATLAARTDGPVQVPWSPRPPTDLAATMRRAEELTSRIIAYLDKV